MVECPHCSRRIRAPENRAGKSAKCPGCKAAIEIPSLAPEPVLAPDFFETSDEPELPSDSISTPGPQRETSIARPEELANRNLLFRAMTVLGALALLGAMAVFASQLVRGPQWEYKIVSPEDYAFVIEMNDLGQEGWEVVSARRATNGEYSSPSYECILKRRTSLIKWP
jgi:hypothetical protein